MTATTPTAGKRGPKAEEAASGDADSIERFAADLRALRTAAGHHTLLSLEQRAQVSKTVIGDAMKGTALPTERTVHGLVGALGGDVEAWTARRHRLAADGAEARNPSFRPQEIATSGRRRVPLRSAIVLAVAAAVVATLVTSLVWNGIRNADVATALAEASTAGSSSETYLPYEDGQDPMQTVCREDAVIAASEERRGGEVVVQMMYSNRCMAVWGRITRYDNASSGNSLSMLIYPESDPQSSRNQERRAENVQSLYTTLMIEPDVEARVCGIATITVDGETVELAPEVCV